MPKKSTTFSLSQIASRLNQPSGKLCELAQADVTKVLSVSYKRLTLRQVQVRLAQKGWISDEALERIEGGEPLQALQVIIKKIERMNPSLRRVVDVAVLSLRGYLALHREKYAEFLASEAGKPLRLPARRGNLADMEFADPKHGKSSTAKKRTPALDDVLSMISSGELSQRELHRIFDAASRAISSTSSKKRERLEQWVSNATDAKCSDGQRKSLVDLLDDAVVPTADDLRQLLAGVKGVTIRDFDLNKRFLFRIKSLAAVHSSSLMCNGKKVKSGFPWATTGHARQFRYSGGNGQELQRSFNSRVLHNSSAQDAAG